MKLNLARRLSDIKIGTRLALSYGAILLSMIAALAYISYSMNAANNRTDAILIDNSTKLRLAYDISDSANAVLRAMRTILLYSDDPEIVAFEHKKIEEARKKYRAAQARALELAVTEDGKAILKKIDDAIKKAAALDDQVMSLAEGGKREAALELLKTEARPAGWALLDAVTEYQDWRKLRVEKDQELTAKEIRATFIASVVLSVLVLMLTVATSILVTRSVTGPLGALQRAIHEVRQGGSMGSLAMIDSKDEMNDMGFAVNQMLQEQISAREKAEQDRLTAEAERQRAEAENESLNNSVIALLQAVDTLSRRDLTVRAPVSQDVIGTVSDAINQLSEETIKVLRGVNDIAGQVAQVSGKVRTQGELVSITAEDERKNVGEMIQSLNLATQSMSQVAELAEQSNRSAERATQVTDTALLTVNSTVDGMESIRETIAETEKRIKRLGERSQEISGIVNLINTIAERTHVLALNASMQAAVAGEAGRGFAVVAEEVQRLAESSRNATQQIATLVSNIQLETNETIFTVNRTIGQVVQGSEQAQKAGEQMRLTQQITGELVEQVRRITAASEQQQAMSAQLLQSVQRLGHSNERTAQQIETQSRETQTLLSSAQQLVESVSVFRLPELSASYHI